MSFSRSYNKRTGVTYVYEVLESKWSPERQRCEQKRKLIGKIDPITGEIVPTGQRGRPKGAKQAPSQQEVLELNNKLAQERQKSQQTEKSMKKRNDMIKKYITELGKALDALADSLQRMIEANHQILNQLSDN